MIIFLFEKFQLIAHRSSNVIILEMSYIIDEVGKEKLCLILRCCVSIE